MDKFDQVAVPQWTQLGKKRGVDPLGMQNSSVRIYQRLLPGISNVTLRVRYYGLYVWLAHQYAQDIRDTDPTTWQRRIRRAEALYALIAGVRGDETGVAGANWASKRLAAAGQGKLDFRDDTEPGSETHYLESPWGVFGQAYQSQLFNIGVLAEAQDHEIPTPAPGLGDELARAFADSAQDLGELFLRTLDRGSTSRKELEVMSPLGPSSIRRGKERDCYQRLLMPPAEEHGSSHDERCKTLRLILHWAKLAGRVPSADELRWSMYSGYLDEKNPWTLVDLLEEHRMRWGIYQANEIAHVALESLLKYLLDLLDAYPTGRPLESLISEAVSNVRVSFDQAPVTWGAYVDALQIAVNASSKTDPASEWFLTRHTRISARLHGMTNAEQCTAAIRALATLQKRMAFRMDDVTAELSELHPQGFRSLLTELVFLDQNASTDFVELLRRLFLDRVVRRHLWVAMRKLRYHGDYTFLIDTDDGLVRNRGKDGPVWTGPRLRNAITFLDDIGLFDKNGITSRGLRALEAA